MSGGVPGVIKSDDKVFWLYFTAVLAWMFLGLLVNNRADWDLWGVMSFGALLDQNPGRFPYHDVFSYTAYGLPWIYHEWGSGVVFYQVFKHFGSAGLFWLKFWLVSLLLLLSCRRVFFRSPHQQSLTGWWRGLFIGQLLVAAYLILPICSTTIRCQLFTFLGYALFLFLLKNHRQGRLSRLSRLIWLLPLLMIVWVNLHGGFAMGLMAVGVYFLAALWQVWQREHVAGESEPRTLGIILLLCLGTMLMNPYGLSFIATMIAAWSLPRETISEWGNVFTLDLPLYGVLYTALLLLWLGWGLRDWLKSPRRFPTVLILLGLTGLNGWLHYKLSPLFLITALSLGFELIPHREEPASASQRGFLHPVYTYGAPVLLALLAMIPTGMYLKSQEQSFQVRVPGAESIRQGTALSRFAYPVGVVDFMRTRHIQANLWAPFAWGEFLYWALYPDSRISIDGRYETIFPESVYEDTRAFYRPPYPLELAEKYQSTHILVPVAEERLLSKLMAQPGWHLLYRDSMSALFTRSDASIANPVAGVGPQPGSAMTLERYPAEPHRFRLP
ncbi:MAG TPA: hypothetical protein V6C52_10045 [Coleofasciculaceae cyanobacterium]